MRNLLAAAVGLGWILSVCDAAACGQGGGPSIEALLPLDGAQDVPLNAALISSATGVRAEFQLRRLGDATEGETDETPLGTAGASNGTVGESVPVTVTCRDSGTAERKSGDLCFATAGLQAHADYEWSVGDSTWRRFSTGAGPRAEELLSPVAAEVTHYEQYTANECGLWSDATLQFDGTSLTEPVVANLMGFTPDYLTHALVLESGMSGAEMRVWNVDGCKELELFDGRGARTSLGELCFGTSTASEEGEPGVSAEGTGGGPERTVYGAPAGGCSMVSVGPSSPSLWMLAACLGLVLRRRARSAALLLGLAVGGCDALSQCPSCGQCPPAVEINFINRETNELIGREEGEALAGMEIVGAEGECSNVESCTIYPKDFDSDTLYEFDLVFEGEVLGSYSVTPETIEDPSRCCNCGYTTRVIELEVDGSQFQQ